jgi:saccharopine dehydrogenase (NAD+, L-lysine-forming)
MGKLARDSDGPVNVKGRPVDPMDFAAAYFHKTCKSLRNVPKEGALRVDVKGWNDGKQQVATYNSSGVITTGTGTPASLGAQMMMEGYIEGKGVLAPEECVDWREFIKVILSREIGRLEIKVKDV